MNANRQRDRGGRIAKAFGRLRNRVSYASVAASVALFVALGGTAAAVTAIPRDSVGSPQIRTDAVRSPEIAKDAVRSSEIAKDAVRSSEIAADAVRSPEIAVDAVRAPEIADDAVHSSEIADGGIQLGDISTGARNALHGAQGPAGPAGVAELRVASNGSPDVPHCSDQRLIDCPNLLTRTLGAGSWLIQAKLDVSNGDFSKTHPLDQCGLEQGSSELDRADFQLEAFGDHADIDNLALTGVLTDVANGTTIALRCSEQTGEDLRAFHMQISALKVTTVIGS
jgi:hypothetical protein